MSVSADAGVPRFLERYQRFEKKYEGDPKGLLRGLMPFLQTASHLDPEQEIATCLEKKDWERLNDLFFQLTRVSLLPGAPTGYDHSGRFLAMLDPAVKARGRWRGTSPRSWGWQRTAWRCTFTG